jgi:hypothetical protein
VGRSLTPGVGPGVGPGAPAGTAARTEHWARLGFWLLLLGSWAIMISYMWEALTTLPTPERLQETRMAVIPTSRTFFAAVLFSGLELGVVLAALWPWRPSHYAARLGITCLALITWFVITTPMGTSRMDWVHRRWLFFLVLATAAALIINVGYRAVRRLAPGGSRDP